MNIPLELKRPQAKNSVIMSRFSRNGVSLKLYTGKTIQTINWSKSKNKTKGEVLKGEENYEIINKYLDVWKKELSFIVDDLEAKKIRLNNEEIQELLNKAMNKDVDKKKVGDEETEIKDFIAYMDWYIQEKKGKKRHTQKLEQSKKLVIVGFNLISKKHLKEWEELSIKAKSATTLLADYKLSFDKVNLDFIKKFRDYLFKAQYKTTIKDEVIMQNYKINYIDKQVKGLKQFISAAIEDKFVKPFTWRSIQAEDREVDSVYTDFEEIQSIYNVNLTKPTEELVRDKYVLNCFLGLRYSDLNKLEPHVFKKRNISDREYVVYSDRAQKTDQKVEFALHPTAIAILEKYNYNLPKLSAKEFNEILKVVSKKAGLIELERIREIRGSETMVRNLPKFELMSSHAGRRSFCTNFYAEGVAIAAIMSISGHSTEKEFRKYIKKTSVRIEVVAAQVSAIKGINHLRIA